MRRARQIIATLVAGTATAAALATPAGATTVGIESGVLKVRGAGAEANHVRVYFDPARFQYAIEDTGATTTSVGGPWCDATTPQVTHCNMFKFTSVDVQLGGGGSWAQNQLTLLPVTLRAGSGQDTLIGGPGSALTTLVAGAGGTTMQAGAGPAHYQGGPGPDTIKSHNSRAEAVTCGGGIDSVEADPADTPAADCETVTHPVSGGPGGGGTTDPGSGDPTGPGGSGAGGTDEVGGDNTVPGIAAPIAISQTAVALTPRNSVPVEISCPVTSVAGCVGTITLTMPGAAKKSGAVTAARRRAISKSRRFRLRAGQKAVVPVTLSRRGARVLRSPKGRKIRKLLATVAVRTEAGVKTVTSTITIKERRRPKTAKPRKRK